MKQERKVLVRNLVIAMVAVDAAGIYFLQDRLAGSGVNTNASIEDDALAAANKAEAQAQAAATKAIPALPKPAFGQEAGKPLPVEQTAKVNQPALPAAAPAPATAAKAPAPAKLVLASAQAPAQPKAAIALAPAKPRLAAAPATVRPLVTQAKTLAAPAQRTIKVAPAKAAPRLSVHAPAKKPVTLSVTLSTSTRLAQANSAGTQPAHKRGTFTKAFSGLAHASQSPLVSMASGSLHSPTPSVTAHFAADSGDTTVIPAPSATIEPMVSAQAAPTPDMAPVSEAGAASAPVAAPVELPPAGE